MIGAGAGPHAFGLMPAIHCSATIALLPSIELILILNMWIKDPFFFRKEVNFFELMLDRSKDYITSKYI